MLFLTWIAEKCSNFLKPFKLVVPNPFQAMDWFSVKQCHKAKVVVQFPFTFTVYLYPLVKTLFVHYIFCRYHVCN